MYALQTIQQLGSWERDETRRSIFKKLGYILIEVWSDDYKANKEQVLNEIVRQIL